ncbi:MAG: hypothetical protein AAFS11_03810 [Planctomycetota bacterium]
MHARCAIVLALAGTTAAAASAQPTSDSLLFERFATVPHMGQFDVHPTTGEIAVGTTGPGSAAKQQVRVVGTDGTVRGVGAAVSDPDAVVWDVHGTFGSAGSILSGGVGGIFSIDPAGPTSLVFSSGVDFGNPEDLDFSDTGELLLADFSSARVQSVDALGRFSTVAVSGSPINQVAVSPATGEIIFGDQAGNVSDTGVTGRLLSNGTGPHLTGLAFGDGSARWGDDVYAVDAATGDLLRFDGEVSSIIATGLFDGVQPGGLNGAGIGFLPGGDMIVGVPATDTMWRVIPTPGTGALLALGGLTALRRRR